ncbi:hypothetical protein QJS04_geneDACA019611 [Acorus gramineus]|uniref:Matrin-type domain-containing protein n=1 Tax=Acorus gramineus TaxID=55184 RepID=A0AAV9BKU7_ACOGR|nr:hypothetical protein QJS04_geneDACA019611 [Acorus gramineus]
MTEYWVSQGNKWCDFCKIYISNNPLSIRTHELGQRHKDSVAKRLDTMRKEGAAKEKEKKMAAKALQQIEAKANRSYQKDLASFRETQSSSGSSAQNSGHLAKDERNQSKPTSLKSPSTSTSLNPMRTIKGAPSSIAVKKRKRVDEKPKVVSKEEAAALKAREAARKRMEEREKPMLGLYKPL